MSTFPGIEGPCPECGAGWKDGRGSRILGRVERDNVQDWTCPDCGARWNRWTGKALMSRGWDDSNWPKRGPVRRPRIPREWRVLLICMSVLLAACVLAWWWLTERLP